MSVESVKVDVVSDRNLGELVGHTWDGRSIYMRPEEDISTDAIIAAQARGIKGKNVDLKLIAQLQAIALFTVDGEPLTIDMLTKKPSENSAAIGWRAMLLLQQKSNEFNDGIPSGKTSSEPAES